MSLYKRGTVYWSYIWIHGVRHAKSLNTSNRQQALRREDEFRCELDIRRHKHTDLNPEMPFSQLAATFLGNEINRLQADEYRRHRKNADSVTDSTVNRDLEALRHI